MYYHIKGTLQHIEPGIAVIDCGGVGYSLFISDNTYKRLTQGEEVKLYSHLNVREDALDLFGFYELDEKNSFKQLHSVSGVGPKVAMAILSALTPQQVAVSIAANDIKAFTNASGVGPKLAQRIVLELKDKIAKEQLTASVGDIGTAYIPAGGSKSEAVNALCVLGYSRSEAQQAVGNCKMDDTASVEDIIKQALKHLL